MANRGTESKCLNDELIPKKDEKSSEFGIVGFLMKERNRV